MITYEEYTQSPTILSHAFYMQFVNPGLLAAVAIYFNNHDLRNRFDAITPQQWHLCAQGFSTWIEPSKLKEAGVLYTPALGIHIAKAAASHLNNRPLQP